jgi:hypothetical protein
MEEIMYPNRIINEVCEVPFPCLLLIFCQIKV